MSEVTGVVQAVKQRDRGYGVCLSDGQWYDGWERAPVRDGQAVVIRFSTMGKNGTTYRNVEHIEVAGCGSGSERQPRVDRINRAVALKAACIALSGTDAGPGQLVGLASVFASWLDGKDNGTGKVAEKHDEGSGEPKQEDEASASSSHHCGEEDLRALTGDALCWVCGKVFGEDGYPREGDPGSGEETVCGSAAQPVKGAACHHQGGDGTLGSVERGPFEHEPGNYELATREVG